MPGPDAFVVDAIAVGDQRGRRDGAAHHQVPGLADTPPGAAQPQRTADEGLLVERDQVVGVQIAEDDEMGAAVEVTVDDGPGPHRSADQEQERQRVLVVARVQVVEVEIEIAGVEVAVEDDGTGGRESRVADGQVAELGFPRQPRRDGAERGLLQKEAGQVDARHNLIITCVKPVSRGKR